MSTKTVPIPIEKSRFFYRYQNSTWFRSKPSVGEIRPCLFTPSFLLRGASGLFWDCFGCFLGPLKRGDEL